MSFDLALIVPFIPVFLMALTLHEFAHGWVALHCGDPTAKFAGRVTLNPLKHLDPLGTLFMFVVHFGWAKPVPVNPANFTRPRAELWVGVAGIVANLLQAVGYALLWHLILRLAPMTWVRGGMVATMLGNMIFLGISINLSLALFNLLPLFPLDGAHVWGNLLPRRQAYRFAQFSERYGTMLLLAMLLLPHVSDVAPLNILIGVPRRWLTQVLLQGI